MIRFSYKRTQSAWTEPNFLRLLEIMETYRFPKPSLASKMHKNTWKDFPITHFKDKNLLKALVPVRKRSSDYIVMIDNASEEHVHFAFTQGLDNILVLNRLKSFLTNPEIKSLFYDLSQLEGCDYGWCSIFEDKLYTKNFTSLDFSNKMMLNWLQFYKKDHLEKIGGFVVFESNPYVQTQRIHDGLFIQVGEDPAIFDTPAGEALLINAINALPLIKQGF
ncbi:MAG: hypothetical protein RLZZ628_4371 [Bacteroidota bacterium]|jgi:hypothetical protein